MDKNFLTVGETGVFGTSGKKKRKKKKNGEEGEDGLDEHASHKTLAQEISSSTGTSRNHSGENKSRRWMLPGLGFRGVSTGVYRQVKRVERERSMKDKK